MIRGNDDPGDGGRLQEHGAIDAGLEAGDFGAEISKGGEVAGRIEGIERCGCHDEVLIGNSGSFVLRQGRRSTRFGRRCCGDRSGADPPGRVSGIKTVLTAIVVKTETGQAGQPGLPFCESGESGAEFVAVHLLKAGLEDECAQLHTHGVAALALSGRHCLPAGAAEDDEPLSIEHVPFVALGGGEWRSGLPFRAELGPLRFIVSHGPNLRCPAIVLLA